MDLPPLPVFISIAHLTRTLTNRFLKSIRIYTAPQALNGNEFQLNVHQFESFSIYLREHNGIASESERVEKEIWT